MVTERTQQAAPNRHLTAFRRWLSEPVDATPAAGFRIAFGAVMLLSTLRFVARGWVDAFYVAPRFHFSWPGFGWLEPWPRPVLYAHFALLALCALLVMLGIAYRWAAAALCLGFSCVELFDKTYYLNHYYLITLLAGLCVVLPLDRTLAWGVAARAASVPRIVPLLLRAQLVLVYFFAGLAKLDADWLLRAQPLSTWLSNASDLPLIGGLLAVPATAHMMAWAGALFDLTIPIGLLWPRTRRYALLLVIGFHAATALLFPIGVFPWLMIALSPIFFDWSLPRAWRRAHAPVSAQPFRMVPTAALALGCAYLLLQVGLPLRHLAYPGAVNWTEQGFRFAWRVLLIEKTGQVEFHVREPGSGRQWSVSARDELTPMQLQMMSTQPDMIAQYAQHLAQRFAAQGYPAVEVRADAWASLNGRSPRRLVDPTVDLARPVGLFTHSAYVTQLDD